MAEPVLLEKLRKALTVPLEQEMHLVYVLVEIRKYLELGNRRRKQYPVLHFHCCWAVHSKAKGLGTDRILLRFDQAFEHFRRASEAPKEMWAELAKTMGLQKLREEMREFLKAKQSTFNPRR